MEIRSVYLGLGGNLGDPASTFEKVLDKLSNHEEIFELRCSPFYTTTPVSAIPQGDYLNAVCMLKTSLDVEALSEFVVSIEEKLGKLPKEKDAPRIIDIDILFFGTKRFSSGDLEIPHPRWHERLFVLRPLADLTDSIELENEIIDLKKMLENFNNRHQEIVRKLEKVTS